MQTKKVLLILNEFIDSSNPEYASIIGITNLQSLIQGTNIGFSVEFLTLKTEIKLTWSKLAGATVSISKIVSFKGGKIKINWSKISGVNGYQIARATSKSGSYSSIKTIIKLFRMQHFNLSIN